MPALPTYYRFKWDFGNFLSLIDGLREADFNLGKDYRLYMSPHGHRELDRQTQKLDHGAKLMMWGKEVLIEGALGDNEVLCFKADEAEELDEIINTWIKYREEVKFSSEFSFTKELELLEKAMEKITECEKDKGE